MQLYIYSNRILCVSQLFLMIIIENYMITVNTSPQFFAQSQYPKHFFSVSNVRINLSPGYMSFFSFACIFLTAFQTYDGSSILPSCSQYISCFVFLEMNVKSGYTIPTPFKYKGFSY